MTAETLTHVDKGDKSVEYLRYIFGDTVNVILGEGGPGSIDSVLGALSNVLNTGMLYFTGLIVGYVSLVGLMNSANEGNPLGKLYSTLWIPLRMTVALALVLPFAGGYSTMQTGVLWLAGQGIGLANSSTKAALNFIKGNGTLYPPHIAVNFDEIGKNILMSRVCMNGINTLDDHVNIEEKPIELVNDNPFTSWIPGNTMTTGEPTSSHLVQMRYDSRYTQVDAVAQWAKSLIGKFANGKPQYYGDNPCGSYTLEFGEIDSSLKITDNIKNYRKTVVDALADLDAAINPISTAIVMHAVNKGPTPDLSALEKAIAAFESRFKKAATAAMSSVATERMNRWGGGDPHADGYQSGVRELGWISLGAWYWDFQRINMETQKFVSINPVWTGPNEQAREHPEFGLIETAFNSYRDQRLVTDKFGQSIPAIQNSSYGKSSRSLNVVLSMVRTAMESALATPDPVSGMANIGHAILWSLEAGYLASRPVEVAAIAAQEEVKAGLASKIPGGVFALTVAREVVSDAMNFFKLAGVLLLPLALMLAFYLPATPLIIWMMGVAGWFVLVIEATIAAPIWAASHAMPEGNGLIGQRAQAGYMVMLSLFLRPTLMVFGFFASMLLMIVMGMTVSLLFIPFMSSMIGDTFTGLISFIALLAILTGLIIQIAHRAYGLIHELPDKILRFIGGGGENLGEASHEQQNRGFFLGAASKASGAAEKASSRDSGGSGGGGAPGGGKEKVTAAEAALRGARSKLGKQLGN